MNPILFFYFFHKKVSLDISYKLSVRQMIHMKSQAIFFFWKNKKNIYIYSITWSAAYVFSAIFDKADNFCDFLVCSKMKEFAANQFWQSCLPWKGIHSLLILAMLN